MLFRVCQGLSLTWFRVTVTYRYLNQREYVVSSEGRNEIRLPLEMSSIVADSDITGVSIPKVRVLTSRVRAVPRTPELIVSCAEGSSTWRRTYGIRDAWTTNT